MTPEEVFGTIKAGFSTFSELGKLQRSRHCRKTVEKFLEQFRELVTKIPSIPTEDRESFLGLLNLVLQTMNSVLASDICR